MAEYSTVVRERRRMCKEVESCSNCPLSVHNNKAKTYCDSFMSESPAEADRIIMQWAAEHPVTTNQVKFREVFGVDILDLVNPSIDIHDWIQREYKGR